MDPFSFKAGLEAQAVDEWADLLHDNLIHRMSGAVVRYIKIGIHSVGSAVQAGILRKPERASHARRDWADEKRV